MNRRDLLELTAAATAGLLMPRSVSGQSCTAEEGTARDRFWLFACPVNSDLPNIKRRSAMSPVEGALYLGIQNIIMVNTGGEEAKVARFEPPFDQYAIALRPMKRVVWSIVGSAGATTPEERTLGIELAMKTPNFVGVFMDDFFRGRKEGQRASLTVEELAELKVRLKGPEKRLDLFTTFYARFLDLPLGDYMDLIDVVTLWTSPSDLVNTESNLTRLQKLAPKSRRMLGCYMVDYYGKKGMPLDLMKHQCEIGLRGLRDRRLDGMIFLGNTIMDLGFESIDWTREWIEKVGNTEI